MMQVVVTKDGQEERPLAAAFADALQSAVGTAARDAERRAQAESALAEDPDDDSAGAAAIPQCDQDQLVHLQQTSRLR